MCVYTFGFPSPAPRLKKSPCVDYLFFCKIFPKGESLLFRIFVLAIFLALPGFVPAMADDDTAPISQDVAIDSIKENLDILGWCSYDKVANAVDTKIDNLENEDNDLSSRQVQYIQICRHMKEIQTLEAELSSNMTALEDNAKNMKDKEQSFENRVLGAAGIGTVGIGGMMAASALAEQSADTDAARDMGAYLATMQCRVGDNVYKLGDAGIDVGGTNQLVELYQQYVDLAADLKERKSALGMKAGIESQVVMDSAKMGLYDDKGSGIENGTYASLYRAARGSEKDANKIDEQKESTAKNLKTGAGVAIAGAAATAIANYAINHNNKDKSKELLDERKEIKNKYNTLVNQIIEECNKNIAEAKANIPAEDEYVVEDTNSADTEPLTYQQYVKMINDMQPLKDATEISKIKDIPVCRK